MIDKQIELIEAKIRASQSVNEATRAELLGLLASLKSECASLGETHEEAAHSIAGFTQLSAHESTRSERKPELLETALKGLSGSVQGLETSHPELVNTVNRITLVLSNMGI